MALLNNCEFPKIYLKPLDWGQLGDPTVLIVCVMGSLTFGEISSSAILLS